MYRLLAVGFSVTVIILSLLAAVNPTSGLSIIMETSVGVAIFRIALCLLLLVYSLLPRFRYDLPRKTLVLGAVGIAWYFAINLFIDGTPFPLPLDLFFGLHGATLAIVAGLDYERPKAVQRFMPRMTHEPWSDALVNLTAKLKQLRPTLAPPTRQKHA